MASEKDICNLALQRIGQFSPITALSDDSDYANMASRAYPVVRDALLERHAWNFATSRVSMPKVDVALNGWASAYALPSDCISVLAVHHATERGHEPCTYEWVIESVGSHNVLFTDCNDAVIKYIKRVPESGMFSPMFVDALAWLLAAELAGPIVKGDTGVNIANKLMETARLAEVKAIQSDVNQRRTKVVKAKASLYA